MPDEIVDAPYLPNSDLNGNQRDTSFPNSGLETHIPEAPLRRLTDRYCMMENRYYRNEAELGGCCVPSPGLGRSARGTISGTAQPRKA